jgi:hypothetical protein
MVLVEVLSKICSMHGQQSDIAVYAGQASWIYPVQHPDALVQNSMLQMADMSTRHHLSDVISISELRE